MDNRVGIQKCSCGDPFCKDYWLTGFGKFTQGSGFTKQEAERVADLLNREPVKITGEPVEVHAGPLKPGGGVSVIEVGTPSPERVRYKTVTVPRDLSEFPYFCPACGGPVNYLDPEGQDVRRAQCQACRCISEFDRR